MKPSAKAAPEAPYVPNVHDQLMLWGSDICPAGRPGIRVASLYGITAERLAQGAYIVNAVNSHMGLVGALNRIVKNLSVMAPDGDALAIAEAALAGQPSTVAIDNQVAQATPDYTGLIAALTTKLDKDAQTAYDNRDMRLEGMPCKMPPGRYAPS